MNPARRAAKGFIWSVRLSEAKPSRNSWALAASILCTAKIVVTVGGRCWQVRLAVSARPFWA